MDIGSSAGDAAAPRIRTSGRFESSIMSEHNKSHPWRVALLCGVPGRIRHFFYWKNKEEMPGRRQSRLYEPLVGSNLYQISQRKGPARGPFLWRAWEDSNLWPSESESIKPKVWKRSNYLKNAYFRAFLSFRTRPYKSNMYPIIQPLCAINVLLKSPFYESSTLFSAYYGWI